MRIDTKTLDDITRKLADNMPKGMQAFRDDMEKGLRAGLETLLQRLDLVTREEFDVQAALLARSRERLEALETRVRQLETERSEQEQPLK